jgi:predicted metalloprotease with PDZ domain
MKYSISYQQAHKHFIDIELNIDNIEQNFIYLQLPSWRPGRYELTNFSRNIQKFDVINEKGMHLPFQKVSREKWEINTGGNKKIKIRYNCYACQMDAGGCWLDDEQLYINPIYCMMYQEGREHEPCTLKLDVPKDYQIACGLPKKGNLLAASDFFHLVDSPLIASRKLQHKFFKIEKYSFSIWAQTDIDPDWQMILSDFKKFSEEQIKLFGEFPEDEYHFLFQLLPYKQYHGVEHRNSTVVTLGPSEIFHTEPLYNSFIGISSHELFHAWNIVKIRPVEMLPYDLTKENYFRTGFVAEGVTTYYGDLMLVRSGVISQEQYFNELNTTFKKHFENFGRFNLSLSDSSFDMWVDGYVQGIPNRKVSIYGKGAVVALILDLEIRMASNNKKSLDDVMKILYYEFGKKQKGYSMKDFQDIVEKVSGVSFQDYFDECISGIVPIEKRLTQALRHVGCDLEVSSPKAISESIYGFKTVCKDGKTSVDMLEPDSPSDHFLTKDDEIIAINSVKISNNINDLIGTKKTIEVAVFRKNKLYTFILESDKKTYWKQYKIVKRKNATEVEKNNFKKWLKAAF